MIVAAAFAPVSTAISAATPAWGAVTCKTAMAAVVMAIATPSAPMPASWSCQKPLRARTPNVKWRFAAVFASEVITSASTFAIVGEAKTRRSA